MIAKSKFVKQRFAIGDRYVDGIAKSKRAYRKARNVPEYELLENAIDKRLSQLEWSLRRLDKIGHRRFLDKMERVLEITATMQALGEEK